MRQGLAIMTALALWQGWASAQKDILRDIARALREPKPVAELLARTPMVVVANDETLFNLFRSFLPPVSAAEFIPLSDLPKRAEELAQTQHSVVVVIDRSRGDFPIEHRQLVPTDLTLIRRQDVVIATDFVGEGRRARYRVFLSAPSFHALQQGVERFCQRTARQPSDLRFQETTPVPISVVITNAGQGMVNAFAERAPLDFVWATPDDLARVQDLLVTETEIYLLVPPVPERVRERLPFNLSLLSPNQSVVVRKSKGGNYWQVLLYGAFPDALKGLIRRYADLKVVPDEPTVITHPVIGSIKRLLIVPFGEFIIYRDRVGDFALQVFRAVQAGKFAEETVAPTKLPEPLLDWSPFQDGTAEAKHFTALAKTYDAELVLAGRLIGFDTKTVRKQELSSSPSPAADRRIFQVATVRIEQVTAQLQVRLYDGHTGETIWTKIVEGNATKRTVESVRRTEAKQPPALEPDHISVFVYENQLYPSAATAAVAELIEALRTEIRWLAEPLVSPVTLAPATPTIVEGIVGQVESDTDGITVYADIGNNQGVKVGDTLLLYRDVVVKTERKTVRLEEEIGEAKIVAVFPEACKAIVVSKPKGKVEVGIRARLVKQPPAAEKPPAN